MKVSANRYLKRIGLLVGEKNDYRALQAFVAVQRFQGESLDELARRLGVSRIIYQRLPFEGGLFRLPHGELVIKVNAQSSFARKRFTLAHEIAHLLLNTVPAFRSTCKTDVALERTCDLIAAELLMPTNETVDFIRGLGPPSPENLRTIASKYGVSTQAAALRVLYDFKLWKCAIGMWEVKPALRTLWFAGRRKWDDVRPDMSCLELALTSNASIQTNDLWPRGACTECVWLTLLGIGGIGSSRVLGLVDFVH